MNCRAIAQGSSERNITICVKQEDLSAGLRAVHAEFAGLAKERVLSVGVIGTGVVGSSLLDQLAAFSGSRTDIQVCAIAGSKQMITRKNGVNLDGRAKGLAEIDPEAELQATDLQALGDFVKQGSSRSIIVDCTASGDVSAMYP